MNTTTQTIVKPMFQKRSRIHTTLLDLVQAVNQYTTDDHLVAATVAHLVNSGRAQLTGNFKGRRIMIQ